jgi:hypothetical protein
MNRKDQTRDRRGRPTFYTRGFTTFLICLDFLVVATTGIILFASPKGRVANWTGWSVAGLDKHGWSELHTTATTLFILIVGLHLFFNWKVLLVYIRSRRQSGFRLKKEFAAALVTVAIVVIGTVEHVPPFGTLVDAGESIKDYWERSSVAGPVVHGEELSLQAFAERAGLVPEDMVNTLTSNGLTGVHPGAQVFDIARTNNRSPEEIYKMLPVVTHRPSDTPRGSGFGRKTLADLCRVEEIEISAAVGRLRELDPGSGEDSRISEIANRLGKRPFEIVEIARGMENRR